MSGLTQRTDDNVSGQLNPNGVNVLRAFPGAGMVVWGARTLKGDDTRLVRVQVRPGPPAAPTTSRARSTSARSSRSSSPTTPTSGRSCGSRSGRSCAASSARAPSSRARSATESDSFFVDLRRDGQPAVRDRPRPRQRRRRLRAAQAGRVRRHHDHPDLAAGGVTWPSSPSTRLGSIPTSPFMFRVKWDGQYVAGLSKMSALKRSTDPVSHRDGGDPSHRAQEPGQVEVRGGDARARRHARSRVRGSGRTSCTRSRARSR